MWKTNPLVTKYVSLIFVDEVPYRNYELGIELIPKPRIIIYFFITKFRLKEVHFIYNLPINYGFSD